VTNEQLQAGRMPAPTFVPGQRVKYVPLHAHGNQSHPDCEVGEVTLVNGAGVFVRFTEPKARHWPQCCDPETLVHTL
jgi:hypothetical protein